MSKTEKIFIFCSLLFLVIISYLCKSNLASIVTAVCGILYTFLIGKKMKIAYFFGIINVTIYGIILYTKGIYGGAIYNLFYSLPILIIGYYYWSNKIDDDKYNKFNKKQSIFVHIILASITLISIIILFFQKDIILFCDIMTTGFSVIGIYLLSKKYIEQWSVWIIANFIGTILWLYLSFLSIDNVSVFIMWLLYFINSLYGYHLWHKQK